MRITGPAQDFGQIQDFKTFRDFVASALSDMLDVINGNIDLVDNSSTFILTATFSASDADTTFVHQLGRQPSGYIVVGRNSAFEVYNGTIQMNPQSITLRASAPGTAQIMVF